MRVLVEEMCIYTQDDLQQLQHCLYRTFLKEPRLYYDVAGKRCNACRNTTSKYWREGLKHQVFFPPQIRLKMYENRKEYIYLIQSDSAHELYEYYKKQPNLIYVAMTLGKFDLFLQTSSPLEVIPDRTLFWGGRGNYIYPETPLYSFKKGYSLMQELLEKEHSPSQIPVDYPEELCDVGDPEYGWMIYPYVKYDMRTGFTKIIKKLHISFDSFYKGMEYLMEISTMLLPYYPFGYPQYIHHFFVFWSDYEEFLCKFLGLLPCHTSIVKVNDALLAYVNILRTTQSNEEDFFNLCFKMRKLELINKFWIVNPVFFSIPEIP